MIILSEFIIWKSLHSEIMIFAERADSYSPLIELLSILDKILDILKYQEQFDEFRLPYQTPYPIVCVWTKENVHTPLSQLKMTMAKHILIYGRILYHKFEKFIIESTHSIC